jgi:acyl dehydratase
VSLRAHLDREAVATGWRQIAQARIDLFADATDDHQWIHVDRVRAAADGPFGTTVAHGYLTLALCAPFVEEALPFDGFSMVLNVGLDRVRFPAPVPAGSRVRGLVRVVSVEDVKGGEQAVIEVTVEREGGERPVCVAELVFRFLS